MPHFILSILLAAVPPMEHRGAGHDAPYSGLETREVKSLSEEDIAELEAGGGWGLALPAELNGLPGPVHLLELAGELGLDAEQIAAIEGIHAEMRDEAREAGARFIEAERALDAAFADGGPAPDLLAGLIDASERARAELRRVHLSRHLMTPPLLTPEQIELYAVLRGYAGDPCDSVPEGHDASMWRRHNGCG